MKGEKMKTVIHQLKTTGVPLDGMCYVIQCEDSSTVVIDGGMDNGDAELLLDFLKKLSGSDKPVIDAWFLTHAHPDHTYACMGMGARHAEEVTVKKIVYGAIQEISYCLYGCGIRIFRLFHLIPRKVSCAVWENCRFEIFGLYLPCACQLRNFLSVKWHINFCSNYYSKLNFTKYICLNLVKYQFKLVFYTNFTWKFVLFFIHLHAKLLSIFEICKEKQKN